MPTNEQIIGTLTKTGDTLSINFNLVDGQNDIEDIKYIRWTCEKRNSSGNLMYSLIESHTQNTGLIAWIKKQAQIIRKLTY